MGLRFGLDVSEKKKIFRLYRDSKPALRACSLVTIVTRRSRYTGVRSRYTAGDIVYVTDILLVIW